MEQSISLPGSPPPERTPLRLRTSSRALRAASRASAASKRLANDPLGHSRVGLKKLGQPLVDDPGGDPLNLAVAQLGLGLTLKLRVGNPDADDRREAFLEVLTSDRQVFVLGRGNCLGVLVQRAGQGRAEPG